ncbi:MAG TPA: glycosyltransferase family 39 protein, partial [Caldilineaceae bacterium]|nr:glycosyltransferase family 39 protein [Caldilineaceae bacterium]
MSSRTALSPQARLLSSAVLLLAFALRLWAIDARSLWFDEAYEYWSAVVPPGALPATVMTSFQPPLYSYLLHIWLRFGDHAVWLRWLSVAFSLVGVAGMVRLGRRWLGVRGAAIAGLVWATLPPQVKYAQEVAEYALLSALLVWLLAALAQAVDAGRWRDWMGWGLAAALAVYSHYGAAVVVLALSLTLFVQHAWQRRTAALVKQGAVSLGALLLGIP